MMAHSWWDDVIIEVALGDPGWQPKPLKADPDCELLAKLIALDITERFYAGVEQHWKESLKEKI